jgi:hypothetical protein
MSEILSFLEWLNHSQFNIVWFQNDRVEPYGKAFSSATDAAAFVKTLGNAAAIYVNTQEPQQKILPDKKWAKGDMAHYSHIFIDVDAQKERQSDGKYTPLEPTDKGAAAKFVYEHLQKLGIDPVCLNSGNAFGFLFKVHLADNKHNYDAIARFYTYLNRQLTEAGHHWQVDQACKNISRICGIPGTMNNKKGTMKMRSLIMPVPQNSKEWSEDEFLKLVDRVIPPNPVIFRKSVHVKPTVNYVPADVEESDKKLFWAILWKRYSNDIDGLTRALQDGGINVIGGDGDGVFIESPHAESYTTPAHERDTKVYLSYCVSAFHDHDQNLWSGAWDYVQRYLPSLWGEYETEREKNRQRREEKKIVKAVEVTEVIENAEEEKPRLAVKDIPIDLSLFPQQIQDFVNSMRRTNKFIPPALLLGMAYSVIGTLIGKKLKLTNAGQVYYPNLWCVLLAPTSSNKTGAITPVSDALRSIQRSCLLPEGTMAGMLQEVGRNISANKLKDKTPEEIEQMVVQYELTAAADMRGKLILSDECTKTLDTLAGGWNAARPTADMGYLLRLTDSHANIERRMAGDGKQIASDLCISFCGFTQNSTWGDTFGGEEFRKSGLFGRFLPFVSDLKIVELTNAKSELFPSLLSIQQAVAQMDQITCFIGDEEHDVIATALTRLGTTQIGQDFAKVFPDSWEQLRGKIVSAAIRMSMIDTLLLRMTKSTDSWSGKTLIGGDNIDCSKTLLRNLMLVTMCYYAYLDQFAPVSDYARIEDRIIAMLRKGPQAKRMLKRGVTVKQNFALENALESLIDDGTVEFRTKKMPSGQTSRRYCLVKNPGKVTV